MIADSCFNDQELLDLLEGRLPPEELARAERHLERCASCFELLAPPAPTSRPSSLPGPTGSAEPLLAPGTRLAGRYRIEVPIGRGASGQVYRALDELLGAPVALKVLRPELAGNRAWVLRLARELRLARRIQSPHVCRVFALEVSGGAPFLSMELARDCLRHELDRGGARSGGCPWAEVRAICGGLAALHEAGIVHRDLKPANILRMADGRLAISDLGLATVDDRTFQSRFVGTPLYMAPEVLGGKPANSASDVWSLGIVLYELVFGNGRSDGREAPGRHESLLDRARLAAFQRLCLRFMSRQPANRPRDGREGLRLVTRVIQAGPLRLVWEWMTRTPVPRTAGWVGALALALALAAQAFRAQDGGDGGIQAGAVPAERRAPAAGPLFVTGAPDPRADCNCPFSSCTDRCVSSCRASGFTLGNSLAGISLPGRQEALLGASSDGDTVLFLTGNRRCLLDRLMLGRRRGPKFVVDDLTADPDLAGASLDEACCALSGDGGTLVARTRDGRSFLQARLSGSDVTSPTSGPFSALRRGLPARASLDAPVLSADGLTLYYRAMLDGQSLGLYDATRADPGGRFSAGVRSGPEVQRYERVSGVSADGLTLFLTFNFETIVLSRPSVRAGFQPPRLGSPPPRLLGFRAMPVAGCGGVLTTHSPGGCEHEDIRLLEAAGQAGPEQSRAAPSPDLVTTARSGAEKPRPIRVLQGLYGHNCRSNQDYDRTRDLAAHCDGQQSCEYRVDYSRLGDTAPGCAKEYQAAWRCLGARPPVVHRETVPAEAGLGSVVRLSCPQEESRLSRSKP